MLKNFKPVSLILCAGALCFSGSMYANIAPVEQGTSMAHPINQGENSLIL